ncbi:ferritin-like domain-containing protein [Alteromonas sp. a30]|uniref:ferritin-like domain-containing protein n=1 Tax=Alteromonas sp. a30 TaxID=2730917 RepID=UPI0022801ECB|nr:ferritin-like protein [Alteromonas sp. a30]MCY7297256.1 hypothetical protein [Alteromonas sp. a30]
MLKLRKSIIEGIRNVAQIEELHGFIQNAIELEHATIPVYLTGLFSIKHGTNIDARNIVLSVVVEEMLHMSIASNLLNAVGGKPAINQPNFVPTFPGPLPMDVGEDRNLVATLAPLTKKQIHDVFMAIEEPEHPLAIPVKLFSSPEQAALLDNDSSTNSEMLSNSTQEFSTIGQFYHEIFLKLEALNKEQNIFTGDPKKQLVNTQWFPQDELFAITNIEQAKRAIDIIVDQGEGTSISPVDAQNKPAHYYRFGEILYGKRLVVDKSAKEGWAYAGEPVELDASNILNLKQNAKATDYPEGSVARRYADQTNFTYSSLLNALHETFNGNPANIDAAMGLMYELRLQVQKMVTINLGPNEQGIDEVAAPPFQFVTVNV